MAATLPNLTGLTVTLSDGGLQEPDSDSSERFTALLGEGCPIVCTGEQLLTIQAMQLLTRLDSELLEARAQWNQDWFRRIMRIRPKAVLRLQRRWANLNSTPAIRLGSLRRRYHANLAGYLYEPK